METCTGPHTILIVAAILAVLALTLVQNCEGHEEINAVYRNWYVPESRDDASSPDLGPMSPSIGMWKPVSPGWGIPDTTATVGVAFSYTIPREAFRGDVDKYELKEAGTQSLPKWMYFNNKTSTLEGIPGVDDQRQYYISVTAYGKESNITKESSSTKDVFSINVLQHRGQQTSNQDDTASSSKHQNGIVTCPPEKPAVRATIILDADWSLLLPRERVHIVSKMSKYSRVPLTAFTLLPETKDAKGYQVIAAGPGNIFDAKHEGLSLSWVVGCGRNAEQLPVVTILEGASKDGSMAEKLHYDIIGWHVTSNTPIVKNRFRRQVALMGTPVPTPLPTGAPRPTDVMATTFIPSTHVVLVESSPVLSSMIRSVGTSDTMTMMMTGTATPGVKVSISPTVKASKTSIYQTPMITPTPVPTSVSSEFVSSSATPMMSEAPTRTFSPPIPSLTSTEGLPSVPVVTSTPAVKLSMTPTSVAIKPTPSAPVVKPSVPTTPPPPPMVTTPAPTSEPTTPRPNQPPKIANPIERIDAYVGVPLVFVIPPDTFMDPEDGNTRDLNLAFLDADGIEVGPDFWLKFDKQEQTIFGFADQVYDPESYVIAAQDAKGVVVRDVFEVHVLESNSIQEQPPPVAMGATINIDYDEFINNPQLQLDILNRIASVFGDPDASALTITGIRRGSVIITFTNNTIPKDSCPEELIAELMKALVNEDGTPSQALIDAFAPDYTISGVDAAKQGTCVATTQAPTTPATKALPPGETKTTSDAWITNVLPGVIVAFIILLAGIIVFILYRKNRKGKLSDEDQSTFINKGIPIIFAEELDEADKQPSSTPLIMKNEKPPLPPPEYSAEDGTRQPLLNDGKPEDGDKPGMPMVDLSASPPYEPPPPLTPSPPESRNPRSTSTTRYQSPPAYVPP